MPGSGNAPDGSFRAAGIEGSTLDGSRFVRGAGVLRVGAGVFVSTGAGVSSEIGKGVSLEAEGDPGAGSVNDCGGCPEASRSTVSMPSSTSVAVASSSSDPTAANPVPEGGFVVIPDTLLGDEASSVSGGDVKLMTQKIQKPRVLRRRLTRSLARVFAV
jgi:hypothetical protein